MVELHKGIRPTLTKGRIQSEIVTLRFDTRKSS